jgi:hypothetical protein|tara:strand:- start:2093 stop:2329 length:237 start_codon:yes stop_codon:yes gene_type:complete
MMTGKSHTILGAILQALIVFFGLGFIGYGTDHLTALLNSLVVSKFVLGFATVICVLMITHGYYQVCDGILIPQLTGKE